MNPTNRLHAALAALVATLALSAATAADAPHPMVGTWSGTWTRGDTSELTITRVEGSGAVHGAYCHRYPRFHSLGVVELHPTKATAATLRDNTLRFEIGNSHIEARIDADDPGRLLLSNRRAEGDATSMLPMTRIDAPACTAQYIAHTITEVSGTGQSLAAQMPEHADQALIGHWTGLDPQTSLIVELSIYAIEKGKAKGVFCNLWTVNAGYYYALDPTTGFQARTSAFSVEFEVGHVAFAFRLLNGNMQMTREANRRTRTLTLEKTDAPTCAPRFIPRPLPNPTLPLRAVIGRDLPRIGRFLERK